MSVVLPAVYLSDPQQEAQKEKANSQQNESGTPGTSPFLEPAKVGPQRLGNWMLLVFLSTKKTDVS